MLNVQQCSIMYRCTSKITYTMTVAQKLFSSTSMLLLNLESARLTTHCYNYVHTSLASLDTTIILLQDHYNILRVFFYAPHLSLSLICNFSCDKSITYFERTIDMFRKATIFLLRSLHVTKEREISLVYGGTIY